MKDWRYITLSNDVAAFICGLMIAATICGAIGILWASLLDSSVRESVIKQVTIGGEPIDIVQLENGTFIKCEVCKNVIDLETR